MESVDVTLGPITPLVFLTFLKQPRCKNDEFTRELDALGHKFKLASGDSSCNGFEEEDGELQTDGNFCCSSRDLVADLMPGVEFRRQDEAVLRNVAAELIVIADHMENRVVSRASENLIHKLQRSPPQDWKRHLSTEVQWALREGLGGGLEMLPQERVLLVLTMTLVRGVCERVPRLLHGLFSTALQYLGPALSR